MWQRTSKYFGDAHCICEDIKSCMHFHDLENIRLSSTKWELAERLTWEIHRQEEERNPSSNWIENHVDYYLLSQAGGSTAEKQIFLSLPVTDFCMSKFPYHVLHSFCSGIMFSAVSVNKYLHELLRASLHIWNEIPCCWATEVASFASPPKVGMGSTQEHQQTLDAPSLI
jgi:hypothetical protein